LIRRLSFRSRLAIAIPCTSRFAPLVKSMRCPPSSPPPPHQFLADCRNMWLYLPLPGVPETRGRYRFSLQEPCRPSNESRILPAAPLARSRFGIEPPPVTSPAAASTSRSIFGDAILLPLPRTPFAPSSCHTAIAERFTLRLFAPTSFVAICRTVGQVKIFQVLASGPPSHSQRGFIGTRPDSRSLGLSC